MKIFINFEISRIFNFILKLWVLKNKKRFVHVKKKKKKKWSVFREREINYFYNGFVDIYIRWLHLKLTFLQIERELFHIKKKKKKSRHREL